MVFPFFSLSLQLLSAFVAQTVHTTVSFASGKPLLTLTVFSPAHRLVRLLINSHLCRGL